MHGYRIIPILRQTITYLVFLGVTLCIAANLFLSTAVRTFDGLVGVMGRLIGFPPGDLLIKEAK
jgi:hypothetical protein